MIAAVREHWPEYLMDAAGLGLFMMSACIGTAIIWHEQSALASLLNGYPLVQRLLMGAAMGLTAMGIVYSPMGKRSGAHINPAVTLTFFRLGKIKPWDALFYVLSQFGGAIAGVWLCGLLFQQWVSSESVNYAVTVPGATGITAAFVAEVIISFGVMSLVLGVSNHRGLSGYTGVFVGLTLVVYITFEAPFSGMSMNPARTVGSAVSAHIYTALWIYFFAPLVGMLTAAEVYLARYGIDAVHCAKLNHTMDVRCIFKCGYTPEQQNGSSNA